MTKKKATKEIEVVRDKDVTEIDSDYEARETFELEEEDPSKLHPKEKKAIYELWLSIPDLMKLLPEAELKKMGYDTDNPLFMKLISIKSPRQFAKEFKMSNNTPYVWEKQDPYMRDRATEVARHNNVLRFEKDVDFNFTQKVLKYGDANRVKLWKQLHKGWTEKSEVKNTNLNVDVVTLVQQIEERNAKIRAAEIAEELEEDERE